MWCRRSPNSGGSFVCSVVPGLWPGMTNALQIVASPVDAVPMHGVFDARECRFTLAFQRCDLDGHGVFRGGDQARPPHPLAALLQPLALLQALAALLRV